MAPRGLGFLANPYQLATLLLAIAVCLLTVVTVPPSATIYLLRADYTRKSRDAVTSAAWFSSLGYCTADTNNDHLNLTLSTIYCSKSFIGYDVERALQQDGTTTVSLPDTTLSKFLSAGLVVLNTFAIVLCLVATAAQQALLRKPTAKAYLVSMTSSSLALLFSGVAFIFQDALGTYIANPSPVTYATFTTTNGPLVYILVSALLFQMAGCVVSFYSCIGGKYRCERAILLEDKEGSGLGVNKARSTYSSQEMICSS
ncbi:hypothetical protein F5Y12DRAFT_773650 [Xylaria sp. FL1777]|nr:hypothetical protein F5Y12DRAFT_773650 [Xylaria sp. FL1777]